jgi:CRP-like cAMP-binding protein
MVGEWLMSNAANPWIEKLSLFASLSAADRATLSKVCGNVHRLGAHQEVVREGDRPGSVHLILEGFACRYKLLPDGGRSIFAYLLPGDTCDWHVFVLKQMDHTIATLSPCTIVDIPQATVLAITESSPAIARAIWRATLVDESILREWIVTISRRSAEEAIAHLFCELLLRLETVGRRFDDAFKLPVTQAELADTFGLSAVHVNRVIQRMRREKLIELKGGVLTILNLEALRELAKFEPNYLHLEGRTR